MTGTKRNALTLIEYGLLLALIAVIAITVLSKFSSSINKADEQPNTDVSATQTETLTNYCKSINKVYDKASGTCK